MLAAVGASNVANFGGANGTAQSSFGLSSQDMGIANCCQGCIKPGWLPTFFDYLRDELNHSAPRGMCVLEPLRVVLVNQAQDPQTLLLPRHPQREELGSREVTLTREIFVERDDFWDRAEAPPKGFRGLALGQAARLRGAYVVRVANVLRDEQSGLPLDCRARLGLGHRRAAALRREPLLALRARELGRELQRARRRHRALLRDGRLARLGQRERERRELRLERGAFGLARGGAINAFGH